ncbi:MAG: sulfotransferase [Halioglobus sp.]
MIDRNYSQQPIFIVGAPRSGTTLLSTMLSAHPRIAISPETAFMLHWWVIRHWYGDLNDPERFEIFWLDYTTQGRFVDIGIDGESVLNMLRALDRVDLKAVFSASMEEYAARLKKHRWGEKTPGHERHIEPLLNWYPDARVVFLVRDPRAVFASMLRVPWGQKDLLWQTGLWKDSIRTLDRFTHDKRFCAIKYEELVENPERELRKICEFIDEDYLPGMIYQRSEGSSPIPDSKNTGWSRLHLQSTLEKPVTPASTKKWLQELTPKQIATIEHRARREMLEYGYTVSPYRLGCRGRIYLFAVAAPLYALKRICWKLEGSSRCVVRRIVPFRIMKFVRRISSKMSLRNVR